MRVSFRVGDETIGFETGLEGSQNRACGRAVASREQGGQGDEFIIALWRIR